MGGWTENGQKFPSVFSRPLADRPRSLLRRRRSRYDDDTMATVNLPMQFPNATPSAAPELMGSPVIEFP
ncbi:MAG: hypothetical protein R6U67_05045 [Sodalinema sp.]|nr:MAG: hypothetical protein EYR95_03015 [Phormidium sp. SL48-SHIP]